ncbi:hypothetical protein CVT25_006567, partial [Psilocybe cyanescens]
EARKLGGVGWVDVADDELGLGFDPPEEEKKTRMASIRKWRVQRCWDVLRALGPASWANNASQDAASLNYGDVTHNFATQAFSSVSAGEQRLVLLMRALVGRPPVVLLDEVWSGMDDDMIAAARRYLRTSEGISEDQAVVVITHWEDEVPWTGDEVKKFKLASI